MKFLKKVFIFFIILFIIGGLFLFFENVYYPAKLSVKVSCNYITIEELNNQGYYISGEYSPENDIITIYDNEDISVLKHEECHNSQAEKNRLMDCNRKFGLLLNELECYSTQNLPDKIHGWIY